MVEDYCRQNGIDPLTLLENGREKLKLFLENPDQIVEQKFDPHKYPRSQAPIHLMRSYSHREIKWACPKSFLKWCDKERLAWLTQKTNELVDKTPITENVRISLFIESWNF